MSVGEIISICVSALVTVVTGVIIFLLKSYISEIKKYRQDREKKEKAKDELTLGMARVMLLENYYKCERQGCYTLDDREVYGKLFEAYRTNGGDGVIDQLAPRLREMPVTPQS